MKYTLIALMTALLALSACNTLQGMGSDLKEAGHRLEKATD